MSEQTLRHQGLDLLRLLSVVMVIGIHTAGGFFIEDSTLSERWKLPRGMCSRWGRCRSL